MTESKRILILPLHRWIDTRWGSECVWAQNLALSAAAIPGSEVTAVVGNIESEDLAALEARMSVINLGIGRLDDGKSLAGYHSLDFYWRLIKRGARLIRETNPDVIHHAFPIGFGMGQSPGTVLWHDTVPCVLGPILYSPGFEKSEHTSTSPVGPTWIDRMVPRVGRLLAISHVDTLMQASIVLFDSRECYELYMNRFPRLRNFPDNRLFGGGYDPYPPSGQRTDDELHVGVCHHLRKRKRLDLLLHAIARTNSRVHLFVAGTGPEEGVLKSLCTSLGIDARVHFLGGLPHREVRTFWKNMDVTVVLEPFPPLALAAVQEAMLAGCCLVSAGFTTSDNRQPSGIFLSSAEPNRLAKTLDGLQNNRADLSQMKRAALLFAEENFSRAGVARLLSGYYERAQESG